MASHEVSEAVAPAAGLPPMHSRTGFRLIKLGELALATAEQALAPLGVRPRHFNVLATVAVGSPAPERGGEPLSQQEVSQLLGIDPNVLVGVIDELERLGLAVRRRNPRDRRRHVVEVTERGQALLREGGARLDRAEADFFASVPADEVAVVRQVAGQLLAAHRAPIKR